LGHGKTGTVGDAWFAAPYHAARQPPTTDVFGDDDYEAYVELMAEWCRELGVDIWSCCLMPNHVYLIAVPKTEDGLRRAIGETHRRFTRRIDFREKWRGYLSQGRFASFVIDEPHLLAARYVELNPVRAKPVKHPRELRWSSAKAHLKGRDDRLGKVAPLWAIVGDWRAFLRSAMPEEELQIDRLTRSQHAITTMR
jgi:putative transposase